MQVLTGFGQNLDGVVFWGSQSGRAELLARRLAKDLQDRFGLRVLAAALDDFDPAHLVGFESYRLCAFVLSTYGDGDPPDNANQFWTFLQTAAKDGLSLASLRYMLFGLGNSNYRLFNQMALTVDSKLQQLGAVRVGAVGAGDDVRGETESHFLAWRKEVHGEIARTWGLEELTPVYRAAYEVQEDASLPAEAVYLGEHHASLLPREGPLLMRAVDPKIPAPMSVKQIRRLWETDQRLCIHADIDLGEDRSAKYATGDHLAIWPCNPHRQVERLLEVTGLAARRDVPITVRLTVDNEYGKAAVPSPTTVDSLFRHYLEICGHLSMDTVGALADFAPSGAAATRLRQLSGDPEVFRDSVLSRRLTLADLLVETAGEGGGVLQWPIPMSFLLERVKPMQPRHYSICSSAVVQPRTASIVFVVDKRPEAGVAGRTAPENGCYGLATSYLAALERDINNALGRGKKLPAPPAAQDYYFGGPRGALHGGKLFASVRPSSFKLPSKSSPPVVMIGAGTGVAPFRSFVQERVRRKHVGQEVGATLLFMGFRNSGTDFIYRDEWAEWRGALGPDVFRYWTAFSRGGAEEGKEGTRYVQELVEARAAEVMDALDTAGCRLYICGSAAMARDVVSTLTRMRSERTGESEEQSREWVKMQRQFKTLLEDVWN